MSMGIAGSINEPIGQRVAKYYDRVIHDFGPTAQGVNWKDSRGQIERLGALDLLRDESVRSICDFGCGYGAYAELLKSSSFSGDYVGVDVSRAMIEIARSMHEANPEYRFSVASTPEPADVVIASGTFNVIPGGVEASWSTWVVRGICAMWDAARRGIAFNLLLPPSAPYALRADLFWASPDDVVGLLRLLGAEVHWHQTPTLHEATYFARRRTPLEEAA